MKIAGVAAVPKSAEWHVQAACISNHVFSQTHTQRDIEERAQSAVHRRATKAAMDGLEGLEARPSAVGSISSPLLTSVHLSRRQQRRPGVTVHGVYDAAAASTESARHASLI